MSEEKTYIMLLEEAKKQRDEEIQRLNNLLQQKENIINELKERSLQYSEEIDRLLDIKEKVREILRKHICNPSGLKDSWHIDCWNNEDISKLNEYLEILDKESIE